MLDRLQVGCLLWSGRHLGHKDSVWASWAARELHEVHIRMILPPESADTRSRLKIVARALIAERGVDGVGVREILRGAGARNASSLNYHFTSKEGLIEELLVDMFSNAEQCWQARLCDAERQGRPLTVRELVEILVRETSHTTPADPNPTAIRFMASALLTRRHLVAKVAAKAEAVAFNTLLGKIALACPDVPRAVMRQRLIFFAWYLVATLQAYEGEVVAAGGCKDVWAAADPLQNLIDTSVAMLRAPSDPPPGGRDAAGTQAAAD